MSTLSFSRHNFTARHSDSKKAKPQQNASAASPVSTSPQCQFDLALTLLRNQLQQQQPVTSLSRDITRSPTESLLLAALGLAVPAAGTETTDHEAASPDGDWSVMGMTADSRRYKTELCRAYEERGQCRYGERCQFAHGVAELRGLQRHPKYKTELCRTYHTAGYCPYGARCHFVHNGCSPPAPPPTPRDVDPRHCDGGFPAGISNSMSGRTVPDSIQLTLLSAALEKQAALAANTTRPAKQNVSVSASSPTSLADVMTSSVVASILQRRRPEVTLTLDSASRYSPPGAAQSRRSSASIDSGYVSSVAASPTFPVVDIFSPPPPLPPLAARRASCGPLTAPLPAISQSPVWIRQTYPNPPNPAYSRHPPGFPRPPTCTAEFKNDLYFVFDR